MFQFIKQHSLLSVAFAAALALTLFFAVRLTVSAIVWSDPSRLEQPIAEWMTLRYVSRSWNVAPGVVADALGVDTDGPQLRSTIQQIADAQDRDPANLISDLEAAIAQAKGDGHD